MTHPTLLKQSRQRGGPALVLSSLALMLALSACNKSEEAKTPGEKLDSAIAKTEQAATQARLKTEQSAEQAKAKTEETFSNAGAALKDATKSMESSAKEAAAKAAEKMDDLTITTAVSAGLAKDPDLSALKIDVDTNDGTVTLTGSAPTQAARERASSIAKTVSGVQKVDNKLIVKAS
ncbi:BON domain-containing protein [Polaromonas sp.]